MGKKQKKQTSQRVYESREPKKDVLVKGGASLKELLNSDTLAKLKEQAEQAKQEESLKKAKEAERRAEEEKAERKRLENDFNYLLEQSDPTWNKYK